MNLIQINQILALLALVFSVLSFAWRLRIFNSLARPSDQAKPRGNIGQGVLYAYTLGMAPWSKESTRMHAISYLRGVGFHLGVFLCLALLVISPWLPALPPVLLTLMGVACAICAVLGLSGFVMRFTERSLKAISTMDDYFAIFIVSLYLAAASLGLLYQPALPAFYLVSAAMLVYAPYSKIRHCIYFAWSRLFFGRFFGSRAVLPHEQQKAV